MEPQSDESSKDNGLRHLENPLTSYILYFIHIFMVFKKIIYCFAFKINENLRLSACFSCFSCILRRFLFESGEVVALFTINQSNLFSRCYLFFTGSTMYPLSGLLTLRGCCMCHSPDMQQRFF